MAEAFPRIDELDKFQQKLIEILGKGFELNLNHDFVIDIKLSRSAYKLQEADIEYAIIYALFNIPALVNAPSIFITLQDILVFFQKVIETYIVSYFSKLECLRAIQDCCVKCEHLVDVDVCGVILHFMCENDILNKECILDFYNQLKPAHSHILMQHSSALLINKLRRITPYYHAIENFEDFENSSDTDDEDDIPLIFLIRRSLERSHISTPHIWMRDNVQKQEIVPNSDDHFETGENPENEEENAKYDFEVDDESDYDDTLNDEDIEPIEDLLLRHPVKNIRKSRKVRKCNIQKHKK